MRFDNGNIELSPNKNHNYIEIGGDEYLLSYLVRGKKSKGANSNVFILQDPSGDTEDRVIKICKTPYYRNSTAKRILRFDREIRAFQLVQRRGINGVIEFFGSGIVPIDGHDFKYIVLEKAESDFGTYMEVNRFNFTANQKFAFCVNIINNFKRLHDIGIYHRDIKHDNILVVNGELKIGDLGLVTFQDRDFSVDDFDEKIGPAAWLSPEATNKMFTQGKNVGYVYDCVINQKSDVFQIGMLFWYIFQGNLPTGQIINGDKNFADDEIFEVIQTMLQYEKQRRPTIDEINANFEPIKMRLMV